MEDKTHRVVRLGRLSAFAETGAIYDADDLHSDVRWLLHKYQTARAEADAFLADYTAELEGGHAMRKVLGAREEETLWGCAERVVSERDAWELRARRLEAPTERVLTDEVADRL